MWCTKQYGEQSFVRNEVARETLPPSTQVFVARPTASYERKDGVYKKQVRAAVAGTAELPEGPVRLELAFHVGPTRKWWHLWKPTIDALEPLLGRDASETRAWHPSDGRITELGMHKTVDPDFGHKVIIGITASPA